MGDLFPLSFVFTLHLASSDRQIVSFPLGIIPKGLAAAAGEIVVNGVPPFMGQRTCTLCLGEVDDHLARLIMRRRSATAPCTESHAQFAA